VGVLKRFYRRVAVLYSVGLRFLCRHCGNLSYTSQHERELYRSIRKAHRLRERLGDRGSVVNGIPPKPKGMHRTTYWRLCYRLLSSSQRSLEMTAKRIGG
jgi:hypothetical protein